jgi:hypothetical protein
VSSPGNGGGSDRLVWTGAANGLLAAAALLLAGVGVAARLVRRRLTAPDP